MVSSYLTQFAQPNKPLAPYTYYGVGGAARWFAEPGDAQALCDLVRACRDANLNLRTLGLGANLLVADEGVEDVVVRLQTGTLKQMNWDSESVPNSDDVLVRMPAGVNMAFLINEASRRGLTGLECMAGIPGTLGGVIRMNAGGRYGEIADIVEDVTVVDTSGELRTLPASAVGFRYRNTDLNGAIVIGVTLRLHPDDPARSRERLLEIWDYKRRSQPLGEPSAGCVFKNPPNDSAGRRIEQAGLKGKRIGGAMVSPKHANFITAQDGTTATDILSLIHIVRETVAEKFGIELELEIEVWGFQLSQLDIGSAV